LVRIATQILNKGRGPAAQELGVLLLQLVQTGRVAIGYSFNHCPATDCIQMEIMARD